MAKRFTDTDKWKDDWFLQLDNDYRMVWLWLLDNCDHAGFCKRSINLLNMMCRTNISEDELLIRMDGRLLVHHDYWFIPKFLKFQYSTLLSGKPAVKSVVKELFKHRAIGIIPKSFGNDYLIISESFDNHCLMIKDKDKDKVKDKDGDKEDEIIVDNTESEIEKKVEQFPDMAFVQAMELNEMEVERVGVYLKQKFTWPLLAEYWQSFSAKFDGSKFYQDRGKIIDYFMNWLKNELKKQHNGFNNSSAANKPSVSEQRLANLAALK